MHAYFVPHACIYAWVRERIARESKNQQPAKRKRKKKIRKKGKSLTKHQHVVVVVHLGDARQCVRHREE